jgi:hypothetical protein
MAPLEQESNIEVLRAYGILATRELERLSRELAQARHQEIEQGFLSEALKDRFTKLQEKFFGFGREKLSHRPATHHKDPQLLLHGDRQGGALDEVNDEHKSKVDSAKNFFYKMEAPALKQEALSRGFAMNKANDWEEVKGLRSPKEFTRK